MNRADDASDSSKSIRVDGPSEELLRDLCENAGDVVYAFDLTGRLTFVNRAAERLTGYTRDELLTMNVGQLIAPDQIDASRQMFDRKVAEGGRTVYELDFITKTGQRRTVEINSRLLIRNGQPNAVQGIARDVTERKGVEEERRQLEARLQQAQKLESLAVLAGGVAHEFNNILTGILGRSDLALMDLPPGSRVIEHLEQIIVGGRRAAVLTAQLLAYAGGGRHQVRPLDLSQLIQNMTELMHVTAGQNTIRFDLPPRLPLIEADPSQVRQVCLNLVTNAVEALGTEGGDVILRTGGRHCDRSFLADCHLPNGLIEGLYTFLEVVDTGCGMTSDVQARMFEPFFSTKFIGRGLGLAAVLGIVRRHRGMIKIVSAPGQGTTIQVLFPAIDLP